ncbi:MAG: A/G-specific adenine glycosylase [Limnobacter sp.]|nr:A/G-specific adenine glycosylase [Limnobacter sp.]
MKVNNEFAQTLLDWQRQFGRQTLPWQNTGDAYKTWLSEVMLQQTQVATVLSYYARFLERFPTVADLAAAPEEEVMHLWQGLGYYSRARNLHACAKQVVGRFGGQFPRNVDDLETLPGIGRSTAGAIASLSYGVQASILDGNVKRVFCRYFGVEGYPEQSAIKKSLWAIADAQVPKHEPGRYNQALMDLGATVCTPKSPRCGGCPLMQGCKALQQGMTQHLPTPKPKKERPHWYFLTLLLEDTQGRFLLQEQGEKGLWRKLWMPPFVQLASSSDTVLEAASRWLEASDLQTRVLAMGLNEVALKSMCSQAEQQGWVVHELTHRKMHFKTLYYCGEGQDWEGGLQGLDSDPGFHYPKDKPLPRLVGKLLESHAQTSQALIQRPMPDQDTFDFV